MEREQLIAIYQAFYEKVYGGQGRKNLKDLTDEQLQEEIKKLIIIYNQLWK